MVRGDVGVGDGSNVGGIAKVILSHNPAFLRAEAFLLGKMQSVEDIELTELFSHALPVALEDGAVDLGSLLGHPAVSLGGGVLARVLPYHRIIGAADPVGVVDDE